MSEHIILQCFNKIAIFGHFQCLRSFSRKSQQKLYSHHNKSFKFKKTKNPRQFDYRTDEQTKFCRRKYAIHLKYFIKLFQRHIADPIIKFIICYPVKSRVVINILSTQTLNIIIYPKSIQSSNAKRKRKKKYLFLWGRKIYLNYLPTGVYESQVAIAFIPLKCIKYSLFQSFAHNFR